MQRCDSVWPCDTFCQQYFITWERTDIVKDFYFHLLIGNQCRHQKTKKNYLLSLKKKKTSSQAQLSKIKTQHKRLHLVNKNNNNPQNTIKSSFSSSRSFQLSSVCCNRKSSAETAASSQTRKQRSFRNSTGSSCDVKHGCSANTHKHTHGRTSGKVEKVLKKTTKKKQLDSPASRPQTSHISIHAV